MDMDMRGLLTFQLKPKGRFGHEQQYFHVWTYIGLAWVQDHLYAHGFLFMWARPTKEAHVIGRSFSKSTKEFCNKHMNLRTSFKFNPNSNTRTITYCI